VEAVLKLSGEERIKYFVKRIVAFETVWGLYSKGWASAKDNSGDLVFPVWPAKEYADLCKLDQWSDCIAKEMTLNEFLDVILPNSVEEGTRFGVFPLPDGAGVIPVTEELVAAIEHELLKY
jgi:Protein of unknown function (DUF2750)